MAVALLPILQFEDKIIETVEQNSVVVVIGETGSGKSTQLSQILHRRGYTKSGIIAVIQPLRVAAVSVARRVAQELNVRLGEELGYAIRFEDRTTEKTKINLSDPELKQYSVVILDEARERSLKIDILLGLVKRLIKMQSSNLKVLITSATLNGTKVPVFSPPPPNCRRFIVATNIAETSLRVDGVVQYNPSMGMYSLDIVQISKVQANQRAGRAGRTCPGKCYRLYPSNIYHEDFAELKSLDLPDINILKFDFLDPPSQLPLEPSFSRTLIEANKYGSLSQALTVVAMLSAETSLLPTQSKGIDKKRKQAPSDLPDGSGWGDHIQLLQVYEDWDRANYDPRWCTDNALQVRGMMFTKDVRKQLSQIMQKISKGPLDVQTNRRRQERQQDYKNLRRALCVGYASQLAERMIHHNGYRTLGSKPQLVQVHPSSVLKADEDGKLPNYAVYHELITISRPFMRNVCAVEMSWVMPILQKLEKVDVNKLSGGFATPEDTLQEQVSDLPKKEADIVDSPLVDRNSQILAARERFLARKLKNRVPASATLHGTKVFEFFSICRVLTIPGKFFTVKILYNKKHPTSYLESCLK
ncbi:hypothetical protein MKX01_033962 [Papaver californicum]|nr:hypothetical protein MKX01_033962 [Papaver californicum]